MTWEHRWRDLVLAGGAVALAGCGSQTNADGTNAPCGNANPDPCICGRPQATAAYAQLCEQQTQCENDGGTFIPNQVGLEDGGVTEPHCDPASAGSVDAATGD